MSTGPIWKDVTDAVARGEKQGADRERRKIRLALQPIIAGLRRDGRIDVVEWIDAATRRPRKRK